MGRIWSCGFEMNSTSTEWLNGTGSPTIVTSPIRGGGTYALKISSLSSGSAQGADNSWSGGSNGPIYMSVWINVTTYPSAENTIFAVRNTSTSILYMTMDNSGTIRLYSQGGSQITGTASVSTGTWTRLDLHYDRTPSAGSQVGEGRVNGVTFASSSSLTYSSNSDRIVVGGNMNLETQTTGLWYFDDWKLNDNTGSFENSWPSSGYILHVHPNGAGDNAQWSRGGTDSGANWSQVNETAPNDATNYVTSNTTGNLDDYTLTSSGIGASDTVNMVAVCFREQGVGASANASFKLRIKASSGGTVTESSTLTPSNATWRTNRIGASPVVYQLVSYQQPGTSNAWTKAALGTTQIGLHLTASSTNGVNISTEWLAVDYTPASGAKILTLLGVG